MRNTNLRWSGVIEVYMIETPRLTIVDRQPQDVLMEELQYNLHPELKELDPAVGECRNPVYYTIFTKDTNIHIGLCCLYNLTGTNIEFGVSIFLPEYWNQGYGSEIVNALCEHIFNNYPQVMAVLAKTPSYNVRARRCYVKCKFTEHARATLNGYDMVFMARGRYNPV